MIIEGLFCNMEQVLAYKLSVDLQHWSEQSAYAWVMLHDTVATINDVIVLCQCYFVSQRGLY